MSQPVVDTLQLCDALRKTGMEREQAEGIARALGDELGAHVVAQGDLQTGFLELRGEIQSVDHRVDLARTELVGQIRILDGKVDSVRTWAAGSTRWTARSTASGRRWAAEFGSLQTTLRIVGGGVGLLIAALDGSSRCKQRPWHGAGADSLVSRRLRKHVSAPTAGGVGC